jgi:hypothetical protein
MPAEAVVTTIKSSVKQASFGYPAGSAHQNGGGFGGKFGWRVFMNECVFVTRHLIGQKRNIIDAKWKVAVAIGITTVL